MGYQLTPGGKARRGFAAMSAERHREFSARGAKAMHKKLGNAARKFSSLEARIAGARSRKKP